ncbi:MAG: ketopantoate reductase family protein [Pseudomonadota bacterium]
MRILFLGAGALGGYFGGRMTAGGADVTLLVRPARREALAEGLRIESPLGDAVVPVRTIVGGEQDGPFDVVMLTNKAYGLEPALDAIAPYIGANTAIVPVLNGLAHYAAIEARLPGVPVLGGVAHIPAELRPDGTVYHRGRLQRLTIGLRSGQEAHHATARGLIDAIAAGGIEAKLSDTIEQDLWDKWVFLAALAAGTCLMRGNVGEICRTQYGIAFMRAAIAECMAVATAAGQAPSAQQQAFYFDQLTTPEGAFKASMLVDMEAGNPTEADHILGDMIGRAAAHGLTTPLLEAAFTRLQVYEASRSA